MNSELTGVERGKCDLQVNVHTDTTERLRTFLSYNRYESTCSPNPETKTSLQLRPEKHFKPKLPGPTAAAEKISGLNNRPDDC